MFEGALVYEEDVFGTPVPVGVQSASGAVERFVDRADTPAGPVPAGPVPAGPVPAGPVPPGGPVLSAPVAGLLEAVEVVLAQVPAELPSAGVG